MSLIWSEGLTPAQLPASLLLRRAEASARADSPGLDAGIRQAARDEVDTLSNALAATEVAARDAAENAAADEPENGKGRTHALIIGVGQYAAAGIPSLTTSIHGATKFAEWLLSTFDYTNRPVGSVELLLSPNQMGGDWKPSAATAAALGIAPDQTLSVEAATFGNIKNAFNRWMTRAGSHHDNAAFLYFSGHGLWKNNPYLLPEDAVMASTDASFEGLIDIRQTLVNLFRSEPGIQCFFVDACQEFTNALQENTDAQPGEPLKKSVNGENVPRDAWLFLGSDEGQSAYGPANDAPFFTQELLHCLNRRAAASNPVGDRWRVTTTSLVEALDAAGKMRAEKEKKPIAFSANCIKTSFKGELYRFIAPPEVFVQVSCDPGEYTKKARLFVTLAGGPTSRDTAGESDWYTTVPQGPLQVGADFDPIAACVCAPVDQMAQPTVLKVELPITRSAAGTGVAETLVSPGIVPGGGGS